MNRTVVTSFVIGFAALVGCASPPTEEIAAGRQALEQARAAEAAEYAAPSLAQAQDLMSQLDTELKVQEEKNALFRSYDRVNELVAEVKTSAAKAATDAAAGKQQARDDAAAMIAEVRSSLEEVKMMLAEAPTGKGSRADIMAMQADLAAVEAGLTEVDAAFAEGRYADAMSKAEAANQTTLSTKEAIAAAIQLTQPVKTRS